MPALRVDQMLIVTDDGRVWDSNTGLLAVSRPGAGSGGDYDDITLSVYKERLDPHYIVRWMRRINGPVSMLFSTLNEHGQIISTLAVGGKVKEVKLAPSSASDVDVAVDSVTITPIVIQDMSIPDKIGY